MWSVGGRLLLKELIQRRSGSSNAMIAPVALAREPVWAVLAPDTFHAGYLVSHRREVDGHLVRHGGRAMVAIRNPSHYEFWSIESSRRLEHAWWRVNEIEACEFQNALRRAHTPAAPPLPAELSAALDRIVSSFRALVGSLPDLAL
jgi:hypothetical protein